MAESVSTVSQLPKWKSHKEVEADKIVAAHHIGDTQRIGGNDSGHRWTLACGAVIPVSLGLYSRLPAGFKSPDVVGGYYVRYTDGYESWSPGDIFEDGYTMHTRSHHKAKEPDNPEEMAPTPGTGKTTPLTTGGHRKVKGE